MSDQPAPVRLATLVRGILLVFAALAVVSCSDGSTPQVEKSGSTPSHTISQVEATAVQSRLSTASGLSSAVLAASSALSFVRTAGKAALTVSSSSSAGAPMRAAAAASSAGTDTVETVAVVEDYDFTVAGVEVKGEYTGVVGWGGYDAQTGMLQNLIAAGVEQIGSQSGFTSGTAQLTAGGAYPDGLAVYETFPDTGGVRTYEATSGKFTVTDLSVSGTAVDCSAAGLTCSVTTSASSHMKGSLDFDATDPVGGGSVHVMESKFDIPAVHIQISGNLGGGGGGTSPAVASINVQPSADSLAVGDSVQLTATLKDSSGNALPDSLASWSSSASGVATVEANGLVVAQAVGTATITAAAGTVKDSAIITVTSAGSGSNGPVVSSLTMYPDVDTVTVGDTVQLSAVARDSTGAAISTSLLTYSWTSSDTSVATVDTSAVTGGGLATVTGLAAGIDTVTAVVDSFSARAVVVVQDTTSAAGMDLSGRIVYLTSSGSIIAALPDFSDPKNLGALTKPYPGPLSVHGSSVYLTALSSTGSGDVFRLDASSSGPTLTELTPGAPYAYEVAGDVSPDGSTVIFQSNRRVASDSTGPREIWAMGPDGSGKKSLTASDSANFDEQHPRFSPDGSKIVFVSREGQDVSKPVVQTEIYIMNADGTGRAELTPAGEADDWPVFSPDGTKILFVSDRADPSNSNARDLYEMNVDGSGVVRITNDGTQKSSPYFSPDGKEIVYAVWNTKSLENDLAMVKSDGTPVAGYKPQGSVPFWVK